jgi:hypothetical protein
MAAGNNPYRAVITGDVVGSSLLSVEKRRILPEVIRSVSDRLQENFSALPHPVEIFRGDSWQYLVNDPALSLRTALYFRAEVRSTMDVKDLDTRIAIGIGTIDFLPEGNLSGGDGPAFRLSGAALDSLDKGTRLAVAFPGTVKSNLTRALDVILTLLDQECQRWTLRQSASVSGALLDYTQQEISRRCFGGGISQQAVAQHLQRAGWGPLERTLDFYEWVLPQITAQDVERT